MSTAELDTLLRAAVPPAPERLRTRVAELRPQPRRLPNLPPRRALYVALPVACALAVTAALVHGFSSSPSATPAHWRAATTTTAHGAVHQFEPAPLRSAVG